MRSLKRQWAGILACVAWVSIGVIGIPSTAVAGAWLDGYHVSGPGGTVRAVLPVSDGCYVGGYFRTAGTAVARGVAFWDGEAFHPVGEGVSGWVYDLAWWDGKLAACGWSGGVWVWDGINWNYLGDGPDANVLAVYQGDLYAGSYRWTKTGWIDVFELDAPVKAMEVFEGRLVVGGDFQTAQGDTVSYVFAWDGQEIQPMGTGFDDQVHCLATTSLGLLAGGDFDHSGEVAMSKIAVWENESWHPLDTPLPETYPNHSLKEVGESAEGIFAYLNLPFLSPSPVLLLDSDGWRDVSPADWQIVYALELCQGTMLIGGSFTGTNDTGPSTENYVNLAQRVDGAWARVCAQGDGLWGFGCGGPPDFAFLGVPEGLLAGGCYRWAGPEMARGLAVLGPSGWAPWDSFQDEEPILYTDIFVNCLGYLGDTAVVSGLMWIIDFGYDVSAEYMGNHSWGVFDYQAVQRFREFEGALYGLGGSGTRDIYLSQPSAVRTTGWEYLATANASLNDLTVYGGQLVIAGDFTAVGGILAYYLAVFDGEWHPFPAEPDGPVEAIAVHDGRLVAIGDFTSVGGVEAPGAAAWDGNQWQAFDGGINGVVQCLLSTDHGLYAGGYFASAGGISAANISLWTGSEWTALGAGVDEAVYALAEYDGLIAVGGEFQIAGGRPSRNIAFWDPDAAVAVPPSTHGSSAVAISSLAPNPSNPVTTVKLDLAETMSLEVSVYDLHGRRVAILYRGMHAAGSHTFTWNGRYDDGTPAASGTYLLSASGERGAVSRKLTLVR